MADENTGEKLKGVGKEAVGKLTGDEETRREGEAQQKKAQREDEAERLEDEAAHKRNQAAGHQAEETRRS